MDERRRRKIGKGKDRQLGVQGLSHALRSIEMARFEVGSTAISGSHSRYRTA